MQNNNSTDIEFLVLDYNSKDGCGEWIKKTFLKEIASGRLNYYKISTPETFDRSHSKNLAFKIAQGEIICNVDADNFIGCKFYKFIIEAFNETNIFLAATNRKFETETVSDNNSLTPIKDVVGRIAVKKKDFLTLGGYDESFSGYGFEDYDFINRLELLGLQRRIITNKEFLSAIDHDDSLRIAYNPGNQRLQIYLGYINTFSTICLFIDGLTNFDWGILIDNRTLRSCNIQNAFNRPAYLFDYVLKDGQWLSGITETQSKAMHLLTKETIFRKLKISGKNYILKTGQKSLVLKPLDSRELVKDLKIFRDTVKNRYIMMKNLEQGVCKVNSGKFGQGSISKNFAIENTLVT